LHDDDVVSKTCLWHNSRMTFTRRYNYKTQLLMSFGIIAVRLYTTRHVTRRRV